MIIERINIHNTPMSTTKHRNSPPTIETRHSRLRPGTERVSYVESKKTSAALRLLAAAKQTNTSSLIREATARYLTQEDPDQTLSRVAEELAVYKADSKEKRAADSLDPEMQKAIAALLRKHRKE
jgi:hypothetical protein